MFEQVPGGSLLIVMELGFLGMKSLTSQNQFLLGLGINYDNQDSLIYILCSSNQQQKPDKELELLPQPIKVQIAGLLHTAIISI